MPSAELLDEIGYRAVVFCFPLLTVMIGLGAAAGVWGLNASVTVFAVSISAVCGLLATGSLILRSRSPR